MQYTIPNRTIFCRDNLDILRGIDSNSIHLIYLDPPFNKKKVFSAPIGSTAEGADFSDIFREEDVKAEWLETIEEDHDHIYHFLAAVRNIEGKQSYNFCYLTYMAIRLVECHRIISTNGSLYLHCDPTMSHYLKILLDCIFGEENFRNEIVWCYRGAGYPKKDFGRRHDLIYRYSKSAQYVFNLDEVREPYAEATVNRFKHYIGNKRRSGDFGTQSLHPMGKHPDDWWQLQPIAPSAKERVGYPTQKPLGLLELIIKASSQPGDVVLDPFCGCATTCVAAEKLGREWIGIDVSHKAYALVKARLSNEIERKEDMPLFYEELVTFTTAPPKRTDSHEESTPHKYVYIISHKKYEGEYKVGIAKNVKSRLNSYQTGDPNREYKLEYSIQTPLYKEIEAHIHHKYHNKREWVTGDLEDIVADIKKLNGETNILRMS